METSSIVYRVFLSTSIVVGAVAVVFFAIGIGDGSVSSFNIGLWLAILGSLAAVLWVGHALRSRGRTGLAIAILGIAAVPGFIGGLFLLLIVFFQPRWN